MPWKNKIFTTFVGSHDDMKYDMNQLSHLYFGLNVQSEIQILKVILPMTFSKICLPTLESTADRGSSSKYTSALLYTARARLKK